MNREKLAKLGATLIDTLKPQRVTSGGAIISVGCALVAIIAAGANEICESIESLKVKP